MDTSILYATGTAFRPTTCDTASRAAWRQECREFAVPHQEDVLRKLLGDMVPDISTTSSCSRAIPAMEAAVDGAVDSSNAQTKEEEEWEMFRSEES